MNIAKLIAKTTLPASLQADAVAALQDAEKRARGLLWAKCKVRLFKAGKISKMLTWESERLIDVRPDLLDWDVAPMINITAHGDNVPWDPATGKPEPGQWLNKDPNSEEYKQAVAANYWCPGEHARSDKSHKAQYRRNAGEGRAYRLGMPVDVSAGPDAVQVWRNGDDTIQLRRCGDAWQLTAFRPLLGRFGLNVRVGYEIDNVFRDGVQQWYPIPGYDLRAPLTYSVLPGRG
ncbi:hypothetical protein HS961_15525 [Comamonas piscis]|uniref:Uncharacterized protein n=1 Tax=Comamonas piscis TaxID=1562974 RepID=A0A7G5EJG0_9BURK|nr:hypothetical protein [Comamonas piscis]QMV74135.1 hypothetical protein HS961_15525 [Comamonas piscis]WSO32575.1 hypothetical protein VUJ63_15570 [Comamonas piscis]